MRILLTLHAPLDRHAGAAGTVLALAEEYRKAGHEVEIYSYDDLPRAIKGTWALLSFSLFVLARVVRGRGTLDVVDASTGDAWLWARARSLFPGHQPVLVARSHGLEHVYTERAIEDDRLGIIHLRRRYHVYHGGFRLWEVAESLRRSDVCFFLSGTDRQYAVDQLGINPSRAVVVANGLSTEFVDRARHGDDRSTSEPPFNLAILGSFIPPKGIAYSVPAMSEVLLRWPDTRLTWLGSGYAPAEILPLFDSAVRPRITVVPRYEREDLVGLLAGHDIVVQASISEGFGKTLLEAMACGLAPVATRVDGPAEFLKHDVNGLCVAPRDKDALVDAVDMLLSEPAGLSRLKAGARSTAAEFHWQRIAAQRLVHYQDALAGRRRAALASDGTRISGSRVAVPDRRTTGVHSRMHACARSSGSVLPTRVRVLIAAFPSTDRRCGRSAVRAAWRIGLSLLRRRLHTFSAPVVDIGGALVRTDLGTPLGLTLYRYGFCSVEVRVLLGLLRPGDVFVDGGANVGLFSLLGASVVGPSGRVIACEPGPGTMALLQANVSRNDFAMLECRQVALSDQPGTERFVIFEPGSGMASFAPEAEDGQEVAVTMTTLDDLTSPHGTRVALVKLDIEGAEVRALRGSLQLVGRAAPIFVVEIEPEHLARQGSSPEQLKAILEPHGYEPYALAGDGRVYRLVGAWVPPDPKCPNLVLVPPSRVDRLLPLLA